MSDRHRGLYAKYSVRRRFDREHKHVDCRYFVLDPQHDEHARAAMVFYATLVAEDYPKLCSDLIDWAGRTEQEARDG